MSKGKLKKECGQVENWCNENNYYLKLIVKILIILLINS